MLATMSSSQHDIPLREHSHLNLQHDSHESQADFAMEDRLCPGCTQSAVSEHGGLVVAFGYVDFLLLPGDHPLSGRWSSHSFGND
jgi:hypothetical protein